MASQPYRPDAPAMRPLTFVPSSFSAAEAGVAPLPVSGSFAAAYPPPVSFGGGAFGQPHSAGFGAAASAFGGAPSFDDEPPLLEGAFEGRRLLRLEPAAC